MLMFLVQLQCLAWPCVGPLSPERHRCRNSRGRGMRGRGMRGWEVSRREVRGLDAVFTGHLRTARRASYRFQRLADTLTSPYTTDITHWDDWLSVYELESRTGRPLFPSPPVPANILITPPCSRDKCVPVPAEGVSVPASWNCSQVPFTLTEWSGPCVSPSRDRIVVA